MKYRIVVLLSAGTLLMAVLTGCSVSDAMEGGMDAENQYPVPRTKSILPLQLDNRWTYLYTGYDSAGTPLPFPDRDLVLDIPAMYYVFGDTVLVQVARWSDTEFTDQGLMYRYEMENLGYGYLVRHKGTGSVETRGLYIAGIFNNSENVLLDSGRLWFAYPAQVNDTWTITFPEDDSIAWTMECLSTDYSAWFGRPDADGASPVTFVDSCYLYRQSFNEEEYYHCFHPMYGQISMHYYSKGILRKSHLLISESLVQF